MSATSPTNLSNSSGTGILLGTVNGANLIFTNVPTSDPSVSGQLWSNSGVLTLSA